MAAANAAVRKREKGSSVEVLRPRAEHAELVVQALAQLPDDIRARLPSDCESRAQLELLAAAYGISERLSFGSSAELQPPLARLLAGEATLVRSIEALAGDRPAALRRGDDSVFHGQRIAVVTNLPAHYRVPLFSAISSRLVVADARFVVLFCGRSAGSRSWLAGPEPLDFDHRFLRSVSVPIRARPPLMPLTLEAALRRFRPTVVMSAGFSPAVSGRVAHYAHHAQIPFGIWSGEHDQMRTARNRLRTAQRRRLLARAAFAVGYGYASACYLGALAPELPIVIGRNSAPLPTPSDLGAPKGSVEIVAIGDLVDERKGIDIAIDAIRARPDLDCRLTVIGGGQKLAGLKTRAKGDGRIRLVGPRTPEETRRKLASADLFLFPTRADIFGLALIEAMGAGTCSVVSPAAGAVADVCVHRTNCIVVGEDQVSSWANAVAELTLNQKLRREIGARGRRTILRRWTIDHAADAMVAGFRLPVLRRDKA
jgi:glycosyltransferase involved in cell wall biosynthesis